MICSHATYNADADSPFVYIPYLKRGERFHAPPTLYERRRMLPCCPCFSSYCYNICLSIYSLQNTRWIRRFRSPPIISFHSQFPLDSMKHISPSLIHHLPTIMHALHLPILLLQGPLHLEIQLPLLLQPLLLHISHDALVHCLRCVSSLFSVSLFLSLSATKIELGESR